MLLFTRNINSNCISSTIDIVRVLSFIQYVDECLIVVLVILTRQRSSSSCLTGYIDECLVASILLPFSYILHGHMFNYLIIIFLLIMQILWLVREYDASIIQKICSLYIGSLTCPICNFDFYMYCVFLNPKVDTPLFATTVNPLQLYHLPERKSRPLI